MDNEADQYEPRYVLLYAGRDIHLFNSLQILLQLIGIKNSSAKLDEI